MPETVSRSTVLALGFSVLGMMAFLAVSSTPGNAPLWMPLVAFGCGSIVLLAGVLGHRGPK